MSLRIYNTLTKKKEDFVPASLHQVKMYVCGPTSYNYIHLGNARALVVFDTIRRYLAYRGYRVLCVQNFTDVDDKIINRAAEEGTDPFELSARFIDEYFRDADALRILRADVHPKASDHLPEMIKMVEGLLGKGVAYQVDGNVYFSVRQFPGYGKLSGRTLEEMRAGARIEVDHRKEDPLDFVLWKAAKPGEPAWESPWGKGRPGWHLECSAMSIKYLGFGFDIHGGGSDLIFPHHENEIAQSEAFMGSAPFVWYWMHNGFVTVAEEKMSKSRGNFFIVRDLLQEWPPEIVRFFLLSTHYRSPLDFNLEVLATAGRSYGRLRNTLELLEEAVGKQDVVPPGRLSREAAGFRNQVLARVSEFEEAMDDDFNTASALAALFNLTREINTFVNREDFSLTPAVVHVLVRVYRYFTELLDVLGLAPDESRKLGKEFGPLLSGIASRFKGDLGDMLPDFLPSEPREILEVLLEAREGARCQKNYQVADAVREALREIGIILEDTPRGVRWRFV